MRETIVKNLERRFLSYGELIDSIDEAMLVAALDVPKHKTLKEHLWCVVGARESYTRALTAGQWEGFSCSMTSYTKGDFQSALSRAAGAARDAIEGIDEWTNDHDALLATLAEHEVMHEGQIIRHIYGTGGTLPSSWKWA